MALKLSPGGRDSRFALSAPGRCDCLALVPELL